MSGDSFMKYQTVDEFTAEAVKRFGPDKMKWQFVCPACGHVQSAEDYKAAGAPPNAVGFSCVGRWIEGSRGCFDDGPGPCDYAGGGLIRMHKLEIDGHSCFELAESPEMDPQQAEEQILAEAMDSVPPLDGGFDA